MEVTSTHSGADTHHANPRAYVHTSCSQTFSVKSSRVFLSDVLFNLAVGRLPKQLASAMAQNGLLSPDILRFYPRKSAEELGLAPAQEVKLRKVQEGTTAIAAIGLGTIGA